jgi:hypothetical protein
MDIQLTIEVISSEYRFTFRESISRYKLNVYFTNQGTFSFSEFVL